MAAVSGDLLEITYNHPTVGQGSFFPKAGETATYDLGGFTASDDAQMIDGSGTLINQLTRRRASLEAIIAWDPNNRQELETLQQLANSPVEGDWTFTHINGTVYGGKGVVTGTIQGDANKGTISVKIQGPQWAAI
jgi:hypothetical protein